MRAEEEGDTVREDDRLVLPLDVVAVLPCQHIHLPLVHAQLTDVGLRLDEEGRGTCEVMTHTLSPTNVEVEVRLQIMRQKREGVEWPRL